MNKFLLISLLSFLVLGFHKAFTQSDSPLITYYTQEVGTGLNVIADEEGQIYFLSDDKLAAPFEQCVIRQISSTGNLNWEYPIPTAIKTESRKLIELQDGHLLCMYEITANRSNALSRPDSIGLLKITKMGTKIWERKIPIHIAIVPEGHIVERQNGHLIMLSPKIYEEGGITNNNPYLSLLDKDGQLLKTMLLPDIRLLRLRNMNLVEKGNVLLCTVGTENGSIIAKVNIDKEAIIWRKEMRVEGTSFNRAYDAILLSDKQSYGIVVNYFNEEEALTGIYYFRVSLAGNILHQQQLATIASTISYPRLLPSCDNTLEIIFNQTNNNRTAPLKRIRIDEIGNILASKDLEVETSENYFLDYSLLGKNSIIGVGTGAKDNVNFTSIITIFSVFSDCIISAIPNLTIKQAAITIYPNPVDNYLFLNFPANGIDKTTTFEVTIFNSIGLKVKHLNKITANQAINTSDLLSGIYYLSIGTPNSINGIKFIKK